MITGKSFQDTLPKEPEQIAQCVDDLIRNPDIIAIFKKHIEEYVKKDHDYKQALEKVCENEEKACEAIIQDKRLQDKEAGPPEEGWAWKTFIKEQVDKEGNFSETEVEGWAPPNKMKVPPNPWPWEYHTDGQMTAEAIRPAQFLILAACHDYYLFGKRPLIMTEQFMLKLEEKYPKTCAGIYRSYNADSGVRMSLRSHEEHLADAYADVYHYCSRKNPPSNSPPEGEWVGPMTQAEMAHRVLDDMKGRWRKVSFMFPKGYVQKISPKTFRFRIDHLDKPTQTRCKGKANNKK